MIEKLTNFSTDNKIGFITAVLTFLGVAIAFAALLESLGLFDKPQSAGETGIVNVQQVADGGTVNITNGIPFEKYQQDLEQREQKIRRLIQDAHNAQLQQQLEKQLVAVQTKLQNSESSYKDYIKELQERIKRLEALKGQLPDALIEQAIHALQNGNSDQADQLFAEVLKQTEAPIKVAAEASFQRAKIAKENIDYHNALKHYERAAQLAPENTVYLNDYALMLKEMGYVDKAIEFYEQALASDLHTYGEDHPEVAIRLNNLGSAWQDKGELDKAIAYYKQALASDLHTYGEEHPNVARDRNNLGSAWKDKGELDKAITYYEQALASDLRTYDEDHPKVATRRNNLGWAWQDKGELDKAVNYLQVAFDGFKNAYGDEHPSTRKVKANLQGVKAERAKQLEAEK